MKIARLVVLGLAASPFITVLACGDTAKEGATTTTPTATATPTGTPTTTPTSMPTSAVDAGLDAAPDAPDAADAADAADVNVPVKTYTVKGTVVNAVNAGLALQNNAGDDVTVGAGGATFTFATKVAVGSPYSVTVKGRPDKQACKVTAGAGTMGNADVANVVVDCSDRTSCKTLKTNFATLATGTYRIDADGAGAIAPFDAYCDMTFDDGAGAGIGGWTLIESIAGKLGPMGGAEGAVAPGTSTYLPLATMEALAMGGTQVHLRSTGLAATESITSKANMEPIVNLRAGYLANEGLLNFTPQEQTDRWTGTFAVTDRLGFSCATAGNVAWPNIYHACGNPIGVHVIGDHARWDWQNGNTTLNLDMEVYVR